MRFSLATVAGLTLLSAMAIHPVLADDVQTHMQKAQTAASKQDWDGAMAELDAAIAIDKDSIIAHTGRAMVLVQEKKLPDAIAEVSRVIELDPKNPNAYKLRSDLYKQTGDNVKAKADFIACMRLAPDDEAKLEAAAAEAEEKKDWPNAVNLWSLVCDIHPNEAKPSYELGMALKGAYYTVFMNASGTPDFQVKIDKLQADTKASFDAAIKADPKFAPAYLAQDDMAALNQGLKIMPDSAELLVARAAKLLDSIPSDAAIKEAIADCTHALKSDPKNAAAYATRAMAYQQSGSYDLALADTERSLAIKPNDFAVLKRRGSIYGIKNDYVHEIAEDELALAIQPNDAELLFSHYLALTHLPDKARAFAAINKMIDNAPLYMIYRQSRAQLYFDQKDYKSATADVDKVLATEPDNEDAKKLQAKIAAAQ